MFFSYGTARKKERIKKYEILIHFVHKNFSKIFLKNINYRKKGLNTKSDLFKSSSLISGLGFLLFFFIQSNGLVSLIPIGQKIGLYNAVNIR